MTFKNLKNNEIFTPKSHIYIFIALTDQLPIALTHNWLSNKVNNLTKLLFGFENNKKQYYKKSTLVQF